MSATLLREGGYFFQKEATSQHYISVIFSQVSFKVYTEFVRNLVFIICSLLIEIDCVTDKLKATFS